MEHTDENANMAYSSMLNIVTVIKRFKTSKMQHNNLQYLAAGENCHISHTCIFGLFIQKGDDLQKETAIESGSFILMLP